MLHTSVDKIVQNTDLREVREKDEESAERTRLDVESGRAAHCSSEDLDHAIAASAATFVGAFGEYIAKTGSDESILFQFENACSCAVSQTNFCFDDNDGGCSNSAMPPNSPTRPESAQ